MTTSSPDLLLLNNEELLQSSASSSSSVTERVAEECSKHLTNCSGPSSLKETARQLAKELIERNLIPALKNISLDQHRVAVRDEVISLLLRQMTGQLPSSLLGHSSSGVGLEKVLGGGDDMKKKKNDESSSDSSSFNNNSNSNNSTNLPPGSENLARLISQGSVSLRGAAMTIKRLLEAPDAEVRKSALSLLAKIAEDCARERRETFRKLKTEYTVANEKYQQQLQHYQQHSRKQNKFRKDNSSPPVAPGPQPTSATTPMPERARAMELVRSTVLDLLKSDPSCQYECTFIARCFGWLELPSLNITSHEALGLVRRSHRNVPCYSILAGNMSEHSHINSFVATCSRDAPTIDIFRDVTMSGDYAFSSFSVPSQQFTPLSLVSLTSNNGNSNNNPSSNNNNSSNSSNLVALCCGVEVSERVGLGVIDLGDSFPLSSQTHPCEVKEVFGVSQPTCGIPMGQNSPAIAVGCAVPGGFGVTTVVVETTQRIHTYSSSSSDCVTALTTAFGGDSCIISATRDGSLELWDLRRNPRGPTQTIVASGLKSNNALNSTSTNVMNKNQQLQQQQQQKFTPSTATSENGGDATSSQQQQVSDDAENKKRSHATTIPSYYSSDATTSLTFLQGGSGYSNNLLVSGTADGLVNVWDLRAVARNHGSASENLTMGSSSRNNNNGYGIPSRPLTSMQMDGPVLNIAAIPNNSNNNNNSNSGTSAYFAVSTTRSLSTHRVKTNPDDDQDNQDDNSEDDDDDDNAEEEDDQKQSDNDDGEEDDENRQQQSRRNATRHRSSSSLLCKRDGLISTQQVIGCRTTTSSNNQVAPSLYHDLSVVQNFAGGKHTYVLAGSDGGIIESFRVRYL